MTHVTQQARERAAKSGGVRARQRAIRVMIEGETVTYRDLCERLAVTDSVVMKRLKREQAKPGPVTWEGMMQEGHTR